MRLFGEQRPPESQQRFDFSGVSDNQFFEHAEGKIAEALWRYGEQAQNGHRLQRRLFADDTAQGFAFIDLCRKLYDVVLMNPPFGEASKPSRHYIDSIYSISKNNLCSCFVERGIECLASDGFLGAITSRTGFFSNSYRRWREDIVLTRSCPTVFADLGYGVLDLAKVETASYCLKKIPNSHHASSICSFFRLDAEEDKGPSLLAAANPCAVMPSRVQQITHSTRPNYEECRDHHSLIV